MQDYVSKMQASIMGHTTQLVQAMHTGLQSQIGQVDARVDAQQVEIDEIKKSLRHQGDGAKSWLPLWILPTARTRVLIL
eukprot:4805707-Karenia_brevis.AAC.1